MGMLAYTILIKIDARLLAIFATVLVSASVVTRCKLMPTITLHIILSYTNISFIINGSTSNFIDGWPIKSLASRQLPVAVWAIYMIRHRTSSLYRSIRFLNMCLVYVGYTRNCLVRPYGARSNIKGTQISRARKPIEVYHDKYGQKFIL